MGVSREQGGAAAAPQTLRTIDQTKCMFWCQLVHRLPSHGPGFDWALFIGKALWNEQSLLEPKSPYARKSCAWPYARMVSAVGVAEIGGGASGLARCLAKMSKVELVPRA